jgi:hypothetical protein
MFRKTIISGIAVAMLAVPSVAMADAPDGSIVFNPAKGITEENAGGAKAAALADGDNLIGWGSSAITHNGQFISGKASGLPDWQHQKGDRSALVQADLAATGRGSQK